VDLPGSAAATPIVWANHLFLSGVDTAKDVTQAMAFDRTRGKLLWSHDISKGIRKDYRSNFASASPVTDGKAVIFFYGNGDLVAFDFDGHRLWSRDLQKDYGHSRSSTGPWVAAPCSTTASCMFRCCSTIRPRRIKARRRTGRSRICWRSIRRQARRSGGIFGCRKPWVRLRRPMLRRSLRSITVENSC